MGDKSLIEWTDATWNPVRGCSIVSKGCTNCYAMRQAHRSSGAGGAYEGLTKLTKAGPVWTGEIRLVPELLEQPLKWKRPRRIFVNSMSDLFHEDVPDDFILKVWQVMYDCQAGSTCAQPRRADNEASKHIFQILTKRPERMQRFVSRGPAVGARKRLGASWCIRHIRTLLLRRRLSGRGARFPQVPRRALWDSLNAKRGFGWATNPWVWVVEFKRTGDSSR